VWRLTSDGELLAATREVCAQIAAQPLESLVSTKAPLLESRLPAARAGPRPREPEFRRLLRGPLTRRRWPRFASAAPGLRALQGRGYDRRPGPARMAPLHGGPVRALVTVIAWTSTSRIAPRRALLRDAGAEVIYAGRFQLPETIATIAVEEDVDWSGSAPTRGSPVLRAELVERLGAADPPIRSPSAGSIITTTIASS